MSQSIKVVVRIRPINTKQISLGCKQIVTANQQNNQISIYKPQQPDNIKIFAYDSVFGTNSLQSNVYVKTAFSLVQNILQGYNGTIFAYGQTGCGKTHSMVGKLDFQELQGIIPRTFGHILNTISQTKNREYLIRCSFIEIYNEEVRDLLSKDVKKSLQIKQSPDKGVFIKDLSSNSAKTHEDLMQYMNIGNKIRSVGETAMNKDSSRSHLLFMLYLESADLSIPEENRKYIASKLNLVDLAGSQRINKTGAQGDRLQEAKNINLSLSALGNVISALVDGKSHHVPYRDSKLTRLLQDSLGGNTKTVMIANCSPADYNFDETLSTLRYASRAKFIKNKPIINEDPKDALLKQYANEIKKLKQILQNQGMAQINGTNIINDIAFDNRMKQKQKKLASQKQQKRLLQQRLKALQKQHLHSQDVKIDKKIGEKLNQVRSFVMVAVPNNKILITNNIKDAQFDNQIPGSPAHNNKLEVAQSQKQKIKILKNQIKSIQNQIKDIAHENYLDKQLIFTDIRQLSKQNKLLQGIISILLSPKELQTIKNKVQYLEKQQKLEDLINNNTQIQKIKYGYDQDNNNTQIQKTKYGYDQDNNKYIIPQFCLKNKQISLPKINQDWPTSQVQLKNIYNNLSNNNSSYNIDNQKDRSRNQTQNQQIKSRKNSLGHSNNQPLANLSIYTQKIKNNGSFLFGKGKQNKKDITKIRSIIQQARQIHQIQNRPQIIQTHTKKNLPTELQPLNKYQLDKRLQKISSSQHQHKLTDKPKKLQKLLNYPQPNKFSLHKQLKNQ